jgi:hypothetical protein
MRTLAGCLGIWLVLLLLTWTRFGFSWLVPVSCGLTVAVLYAAAAGSGARGWPLFWILAALYGGIGVVNIQLESLIFQILPPADIARTTATMLAEVLAISAALALVVSRERAPGDAPAPPRSAGRLWIRMPAIAVAYLVLYFAAGLLILPLVRHYYASSGVLTIPPPGVIVATQLVRGLIYALALLPLLRRMAGRRARAGLLAGLSLAVLGGIAPLLLPVDEILPPEVRGVHMVEILGSNFLLGLLAAGLLVRRRAGVPAPAVAVPVQ